MGLFDHDGYGRDYRGGHGRHEGLGDQMRGAWHRMEDRFGGHGGYDREMRRGANRGGGGGYDASDFAYRGMEGAWSTFRNRGAHDPQWDWRRAAGSRYDQDLGRYESRGGHGRDYGAGLGGYGGGHGGQPWRGGADDPYGDRQRRTPFHGMRGGWNANRPDRYDVEYRGWNRGVGDEPAYRAEDFRGWDQGRGRDTRRR
jgi:hypothetical protein